MTVGSNVLYFSYDAEGKPYLLTYNDTDYYTICNLRGDVVALVDGDSNEVVTYRYDAWGNLLSCTGPMASTLGMINPLRYRGYVYDQETELYYLQSRYYDPELGRFINADTFATTGQGFLSSNMFLYCANNPINRIDPTGFFWSSISAAIKNAYSTVTNWCSENIRFNCGVNPECGESSYYWFFTIENGVGYSKDLEEEKTINFYTSFNNIFENFQTGSSVGVKVNPSEKFGISYELGTDCSLGLHTESFNVDFGSNMCGRTYLQIYTPKDGIYGYKKISLNKPELTLTVAAISYVVIVVPVVVTAPVFAAA